MRSVSPPPAPPAAQLARPRRAPAARPAAPAPRRSPPPYAMSCASQTPIITAAINGCRRQVKTSPAVDNGLLCRAGWRPWPGMPDFGSAGAASLSGHTTARPGRLAPRSQARRMRYRVGDELYLPPSGRSSLCPDRTMRGAGSAVGSTRPRNPARARLVVPPEYVNTPSVALTAWL